MADRTEPVLCPKCGAANPQDGDLCVQCGARLQGTGQDEAGHQNEPNIKDMGLRYKLPLTFGFGLLVSCLLWIEAPLHSKIAVAIAAAAVGWLAGLAGDCFHRMDSVQVTTVLGGVVGVLFAVSSGIGLGVAIMADDRGRRMGGLVLLVVGAVAAVLAAAVIRRAKRLAAYWDLDSGAEKPDCRRTATLDEPREESRKRLVLLFVVNVEADCVRPLDFIRFFPCVLAKIYQRFPDTDLGVFYLDTGDALQQGGDLIDDYLSRRATANRGPVNDCRDHPLMQADVDRDSLRAERGLRDFKGLLLFRNGRVEDHEGLLSSGDWRDALLTAATQILERQGLEPTLGGSDRG